MPAHAVSDDEKATLDGQLAIPRFREEAVFIARPDHSGIRSGGHGKLH